MEIPNPIIKKYSVNFRWADAEITKLNTDKVSKEEETYPRARKLWGSWQGCAPSQPRIKRKKGGLGLVVRISLLLRRCETHIS